MESRLNEKVLRRGLWKMLLYVFERMWLKRKVLQTALTGSDVQSSKLSNWIFMLLVFATPLHGDA